MQENIGDKVPNELVNSAQQKLDGYRSLKSEIDKEMMDVHERLDRVSSIVKANICDERNPDGFFTHKQESYLDCLKFQHVEFEEIFKKDDDHWVKNLENARKVAAKVVSELEAFFKESQERMRAILMQTTIGIQCKYTLRKLPAWGAKKGEDNYDFEWPTQKMIDEMQNLESVKLKSMKFAK